MEGKHGDEDFRKKSSFFQIPPIKKAMLRLSPAMLIVKPEEMIFFLSLP